MSESIACQGSESQGKDNRSYHYPVSSHDTEMRESARRHICPAKTGASLSYQSPWLQRLNSSMLSTSIFPGEIGIEFSTQTCYKLAQQVKRTGAAGSTGDRQSDKAKWNTSSGPEAEECFFIYVRYSSIYLAVLGLNCIMWGLFLLCTDSLAVAQGLQ